MTINGVEVPTLEYDAIDADYANGVAHLMLNGNVVKTFNLNEQFRPPVHELSEFTKEQFDYLIQRKSSPLMGRNFWLGFWMALSAGLVIGFPILLYFLTHAK